MDRTREEVIAGRLHGLHTGVLAVGGAKDGLSLGLTVPRIHLIDVHGGDERVAPGPDRNLARWSRSTSPRRRPPTASPGIVQGRPSSKVHRVQRRAVVRSPMNPVSGRERSVAIISRSDSSRPDGDPREILGLLALPGLILGGRTRSISFPPCGGMVSLMLMLATPHGKWMVVPCRPRKPQDPRLIGYEGYTSPDSGCWSTPPSRPQDEDADAPFRNHAQRLGARSETSDPAEILGWALLDSGLERVAIASAFQAEGTAVMHMAARIRPDVPILFLQTGFHFAETLAFKQKLTETLGLNVIDLVGDYTVDSQSDEFGPRLYEQDPHLCCELNKVIPWRRALLRLDGWVTSMRRDSAWTRADAPIVSEQEVEPGKVRRQDQPVADWTRRDVWAYLKGARPSAQPLARPRLRRSGCAPCRAHRLSGEAERAGRWSGSQKVECGIHVPEPLDRTARTASCGLLDPAEESRGGGHSG